MEKGAERDKVTIINLKEMKKSNQKITMLTAYDYPFASLVDEAGIDIVLVGDSLGNVILGYDSTVPVTMDEMLHHAKAVRRAVKSSLLIGDMPFMSYNINREEAIRNAGRFLKEAGLDAVKLEGGLEAAETISSIDKAGIPVLGHLGLTPQTFSKLGGYKVQGKDYEKAREIMDSAMALEKAGCFALVLECIPSALAGLITKRLSIPTIGIGAGPDCDGQVMVTHDILNLSKKFKPKFVKVYTDLSREMISAFNNFKDDVKNGKFPLPEHSFTIKDEILKKLK